MKTLCGDEVITMKQTSFDRRFDCTVNVLLMFLLLIVAYPLYFVVIASISTPAQVITGHVVLWPKGLTFAGYQKIIEYERVWIGYRNTIIYVVLYTKLSVSVTMLSGYALTRKSLRGRGVIMFLILLTMYFSGGLIPTFLWMNELKLVGSPLAVIILGSVSAYNIVIARTFISSNIPEELYEAAVLDGCTHFQFFNHIVLRLSPALLAVLTLFAAVGQWNSWFNAMIYLRDQNQMPLQLVLRDLIISESAFANAADMANQGEDAAQQALVAEQIKYAMIIVSTLPIMCLYPFVQRYFVKGIMIGSIKG